MSIQSVSAKVVDLRFDPHNPRLPEDVDRTQNDMFAFIVREIGVDDLLDSISASGVIEADPMIARPALPDEDADHLYVIEGNRRLAALKLLNGERLNDGDAEKRIPPLATEIAESISSVVVQIGWPEDKLEAYLGYKHVTSSREWLPEAKARFVVDKCKGDYSPETLRRFARSLGTKVPTLRRWLLAHLSLKQAEAAGLFDPNRAYSRRYFGTYYTLLGSEDVRTFLELKEGISNKPVPTDKLANLAEFISWTVGTKDAPPVANSRQQKELAAVLSSPKALAYFRTKKNLDQALIYTEYNSGEIASKLQLAAYSIEDCLPKLLDVKDQPQVQLAIADLDNAYRKLKHNSGAV
jgi:hypothetical protein